MSLFLWCSLFVGLVLTEWQVMRKSILTQNVVYHWLNDYDLRKLRAQTSLLEFLASPESLTAEVPIGTAESLAVAVLPPRSDYYARGAHVVVSQALCVFMDYADVEVEIEGPPCL